MIAVQNLMQKPKVSVYMMKINPVLIFVFFLRNLYLYTYLHRSILKSRYLLIQTRYKTKFIVTIEN